MGSDTEIDRNELEALRAREAEYRGYFDSSRSGILHYRIEPALPTTLPIEEQIDRVLVDGQVVNANAAAAELLGIPRDELIGAPIRELWGSDTERVRDTVRRWIENGYQEADTETFEQLRDGTYVWIQNEGSGSGSGETISDYWVQFRDITAQKQAEAELKAHRDRLQELVLDKTAELNAALDSVPAEFWATDRQQRYTIQNTRSRQSIGDIVGKTIDDLSLPDDLREQWKADNQRVLAGESIDQEYTYPVDGEERSFVARTSPILLRGEVMGIIGTALDITDRRAAEELTRERAALLGAMMDNMPVEFWATDNELRFTFQNDMSRAAIGDVLGKRLDELEVDSALKDGWRSINNRVLTGETVEEEYSFRINGTDHSYIGRVSPVLLDDEVVGTVGTAMDVTERRAADQTLRENEAYLRTLMSNMPVDFFAMDSDMKYTMQSALSRDVVGDVIGKSVDDTDAPEDLKEQWRAEHRQVLKGETIDRVYEIPAEGGTRVFMTTVAPVRVDEEVIGTVGSSMDITDRKRMEDALRAARDELEQRVQERTEELRESEEHLFEVLQSTIIAFAHTVEARDPYTAGHQVRVSQLASETARKLGVPEERVEATRVAGLLHDIGKISIPAEILSKPTRLSPVEWQMIHQHSENAYRILEGIQFPWPIADIVLQHHERMDGSGYPRSIKGDEILLEARILAVADTVEAMAAHRPYRAALGLEAAMQAIREGRGSDYDPDVVDACLSLFEEGFEFAETGLRMD